MTRARKLFNYYISDLTKKKLFLIQLITYRKDLGLKIISVSFFRDYSF